MLKQGNQPMRHLGRVIRRILEKLKYNPRIIYRIIDYNDERLQALLTTGIPIHVFTFELISN